MDHSTCSIEGCDKPTLCRGWCRSHYKLAMKYGDPLWMPSCSECGSKFTRTHNRQKFCTAECYRRKEWERLGLMVDPLTLSCANDECSKVFTQTRQYQKYCSPRCSSRSAYVVRSANPEWAAVKAAYGVEYAVRNRDRLRAASAKWRNENRDRHAEMNRVWRENNRERAAQLAARWRENNRAAHNETEHRRRARKRGSQVTVITPAMLMDRAAVFGNRCWMCRGPFEEWDHVKPLAKGGPHMLSNLRPACARCNRAKHAKWQGPRAA